MDRRNEESATMLATTRVKGLVTEDEKERGQEKRIEDAEREVGQREGERRSNEEYLAEHDDEVHQEPRWMRVMGWRVRMQEGGGVEGEIKQRGGGEA